MTNRELLDCFTHQADGSWLCIKPVVLGGAVVVVVTWSSSE